MTPPAAAAQARGAVIAGAACYILWGLLPLYLQAVGRTGASPFEVVAHRAIWAVPCAGLLVVVAGQGRHALAVLKTPKTLAWLLTSALFIAGNWMLFIWAVANGRTLEASLGYFINPLMNMALGAVVFRERLDGLAKAAIGLAAAGVAAQTWALGHPPLISLGLAATFAAYGLIRKQVAADAQTGLFVECLILAGPAIAYVLWLQGTGAGHLLASPRAAILLALAGPVTVAPLALFTWAARRLPLSSVGFLQFIGPSLQFVIGIEAGEHITAPGAAAFSLIGLGAVVFAFGALRASRRAMRA